MQSIGSLLKKYKIRKPSQEPIHYEFQAYAYELAEELDDMQNVGWYCKLAKHEKRAVLEKARQHVRETKPKHPASLFMWRVKQLKNKKTLTGLAPHKKQCLSRHQKHPERRSLMS
jgi:hypothetical protein